jgi:hypothetical protein
MKIKLAGILLGTLLISTCSFAAQTKDENTVHTQKHTKKHIKKHVKKHVKKDTMKMEK